MRGLLNRRRAINVQVYVALVTFAHYMLIYCIMGYQTIGVKNNRAILFGVPYLRTWRMFSSGLPSVHGSVQWAYLHARRSTLVDQCARKSNLCTYIYFQACEISSLYPCSIAAIVLTDVELNPATVFKFWSDRQWCNFLAFSCMCYEAFDH